MPARACFHPRTDMPSPHQPALKRIRLAEAPDESGAKKVWHSSGDGVDLVTHVDGEGRAHFHELTFGTGRMLDWDRVRGVRTGLEEVVEFKSGRAGHSRFRYHQPPSRELLEAALAAVGDPGDDRYLQHLVRVCRNASEALAASGLDAVTSAARPPDLPPVVRATWFDRLRRLFPF